jgi:glycosyltransferase involved in cell wall biosynthesis
MKGPQYLVMASPTILERYPNATFLFVGPDQKKYKDVLIQLGDDLGVKDHLIFTGPIFDFNTKMQAYAASTVFVLPSGYEGTSQAIFEAMSQARPIVTTNRGGIPFQVKNEKEAILTEYGDEKGLALGVLRFLDDEGLALNMGSNAREQVKKFTYPTLVNQIERIYQSLD